MRHLLVVFFARQLASGQTTPGPTKSNAQNPVENLVRMHEAWGPKASSAGTSLVIKESARSGQTIKFRLIATGLPSNGTYSLLAWPVTQKGPSEILRGVTLDGSGMAICAGTAGTCGSSDKPNDPIDLVLRPVQGEPVRLGLVSTDGATKVFAKIVPVPLIGEDHGCSIQAILLTPGSELVLIVGSGFPPDGALTMDSTSEGEHHSSEGKTDANGSYTSAILPYKKGVEKGIAEVNLKSPQCAPSLSVRWGRRN